MKQSMIGLLPIQILSKFSHLNSALRNMRMKRLFRSISVWSSSILKKYTQWQKHFAKPHVLEGKRKSKDMSDTDEQDDTVGPMHPAAKKFLEVIFQDVTVDGISRRLEFVDEYGGETSVILHAPDNANMVPVHLGFP